MGLKLIVTERLDPHAEVVARELERRGDPYLRFDLEDFPQRSLVAYSIENGGAETLEIRGQRIVIDDVDAVWYRRAGRSHGAAFVQDLWQRLSHARWVSSPAAIRAASNKFEQRIRAKHCGFAIQQVDAKAYDLRIVVFGDRVFACRVQLPEANASRIDWLRPNASSGSEPRYEATTIPGDVAESCRVLIRDYGLAYGAIDLAVTAKGEYVFLELDPNGHWVWIEEQTGLPLGDALMGVLRRAS